MSLVVYSKPTLRERVASLISRGGERVQYKDAPLPVVPDYNTTANWRERNTLNYIREGYKINATVFACVRALANGFAEAPLMCYEDDSLKKPLPKHPLRKLITRPNELMGEREFWMYWLTYAPIGGNAYGRLVPFKNRGGFVPAEIWPYHDVVMWPVPSGKSWVSRYDYSIDNGLHVENIDPREIVHYKWSPDPEFPWKGLSSLASVARQVDTDTELIRYVKVLLQNDAVTRGILKLPAGAPPIQADKLELMKKEWRLKQGNNNRGEIAIMQGGLEYQRIALNINELAADAVRNVGQADIAAAFRVPALIAGLLVGMEHGREGNWESTRKQFTEGTLCELWASVASEFQQSLVPLMGNDCVVAFDLSKVRALQYLEIEKRSAVVEAFDKGVPIMLNELRTMFGYDPVKGGDVFAFKMGRTGIRVVKDLTTFADESDALKAEEIEQAKAATEGAQLQNEAAAAQLDANAGDTEEGDEAEAEEEDGGDEGDEAEVEAGKDNVILAEAA